MNETADVNRKRGENAMNANEFPQNFCPEASRHELFQMLWAVDYGFDTEWIDSFRNSLDRLENVIQDTKKFHDYLDDERSKPDFRRTLTPKMRKNIGDNFRSLLSLWNMFHPQIDADACREFASRLFIVARHMKENKRAIEKKRSKIRRKESEAD